jgi:Mn2+/Fe2+ NRAMP family transporter
MTESEASAGQGKAMERDLLRTARAQGRGALFKAFVRLSGPGWLQGAITLGGGSLAGSLYLGVLGGYSLLWLQPLMMLFGVVMLSAISYVTLSTGERPFHAIRQHVNPVLAWGWAIATLMANVVWCLPQFALGTAAVQQNLIPSLEGTAGKIVICAALLAVACVVVWFYDSGHRGIRIFEIILKLMVGVVVVSFFGVVIKMGMQPAGLDWNRILPGLIPDFTLLNRPVDTFLEPLTATGAYSQYWSDLIIGQQRDVMITAAATAVGINMTFLLPYSLLRKGWDKEFRGLAAFDLATGLFIPFFLATSCVVIAAASQFHTRPQAGILEGTAPAALMGQYHQLMDNRLKEQLGANAFDDITAEAKVAQLEALPQADREMAAMLVKRDAFVLAGSLEALTGKKFANYVFGIGVLGMALSTIIILMVISGFAMCEVFNLPPSGWSHRLGSLLPAIGVLGPFVWSGKTQFWLAVPTSIFGMILLPIAYLTFFLMMNNKQLMGKEHPRGKTRWTWNILMGLGVLVAGAGSVGSILSRTPEVRNVTLGLVGLFIVAVVLARVKAKPEPKEIR